MSNRAGVHRLGTTFAAVVAATTMALFFGGTAQAAPTTFHAHTAADLVTDVQTSSAGDIILLDAGVQYAVAQSLDVNHNLTIETDPSQLSGGHVAATISGGSISIPSTLDSGEKDIIVAGPGVTVTVSDVVITASIQPSNGAAVAMGPPPAGGNGGSLSIDHSLLSGNNGNAIDVMSGGQATVTNSTITNSIAGDAIVLDGSATLNEDTIANNGHFAIDNIGGGTVSINNTILSGNTSGNCQTPLSAPSTFSHDIDSGTSCGFASLNGSLSGQASGVISPIANNGGPTNTFALPAGSPAINSGTGPGAAPTDQRFLLRDATPDIGAFEAGAATPVAVTLTVQKIVVNTGGGTAAPSDFTMTVTDTTTGTVINSFPGSNAGTQVTIPAGDSWAVTESGAQMVNYTPSSSAGCTGSATANSAANCTITNTFIVGSCPQPPATNSANTCVTANVAATIIVTAPANVSFPALAVGETSSATPVPVNVKSNDPLGYQLNVTRTVFTGSPPDIPLSIGSGAVVFPQVLDLPGGPNGPTTSATPIPTSGPNLNVGHNTTSITPAGGDAWPLNFTLGPIPQIAAGQHQSTVTFTAVAF